MNHLSFLSINIGAMSNTRIVMSCVNYSHELISIANFQEIVIEQMIDYYHLRLMENKQLLRQLNDDGFTTQTIKRLQLGFCDRTLGNVVPSNRSQDGAAVRGALQLHGLLRDSGHEEFRGCIVLPIRDENGLVSAIFGRRMAPFIRRSGRRFVLWLATQDAINCLTFPTEVEEMRYER